ncbi:MAG TPA: hypothetical protein VME66_10665, partial [Candidatus Acidoferrales bacterium]|nr:hypothetical protein [Candidatus Acidoferrales bacterium]
LLAEPGCFAVDAVARNALRPILEEAGELLPMVIEGQLFFYFNLMILADCLDYERSEFDDAQKRFIRKGVFDKANLPATSVFSIPQERLSAFYVSEGLVPYTNDFKKAYEHHGLSGLEFELVWSQGQ